MWRSTLVKVASVTAALLLFLQNVPLNYTAGGEHPNCIHCTSTYCTRDHSGPHQHPSKDVAGRSEDPHHAHHPPETTPSPSKDVAGRSEDPHHAHHPPETTPSPSSDTQMTTCGSGPLGMILLTLDKFFPAESESVLPNGVDLEFGGVPARLHGRISAEDIFHPPAARI